jgi:hypothetical protein
MSKHTGSDRDPAPAEVHTGNSGPSGPPHSRYARRALLLGVAAAGAGAAVGLSGSTDASASRDPAVMLGSANTETTTTSITNKKGTAFEGTTSANGHYGVHGKDTSPGVNSYGVLGTSANNIGVRGFSAGNTAVLGESDKFIGVGGTTLGNGAFGVVGTDNSPKGGTGVLGQSTRGNGVYGAVGFITGTRGQKAVLGEDSSTGGGYGVYGVSVNGAGVYATSPSGTALHVVGKAEFSNSGVATIPGGDKAVTVTVSGVTTSSIVLATIQKLQSGTAVAAAVPASGSFTITLTQATTADTPVGWFVVG